MMISPDEPPSRSRPVELSRSRLVGQGFVGVRSSMLDRAGAIFRRSDFGEPFEHATKWVHRESRTVRRCLRVLDCNSQHVFAPGNPHMGQIVDEGHVAVIVKQPGRDGWAKRKIVGPPNRVMSFW